MPFKYFGAILALFAARLLFDEVVTGWALVGIFVVLAAVTANTIAGGREAEVGQRTVTRRVCSMVAPDARWMTCTK